MTSLDLCLRSHRTSDGAAGESAAIRKNLHALVTSFGRKAPMLEVAWIVIVECLEAGYTTETWITQVSYDLPLKTSDILWVLWHERGRDRLWDCNDDEKYSLNPDT
jgi:hypothetical protein